jgi:cellulose 1,4-beta-cellobiosidase
MGVLTDPAGNYPYVIVTTRALRDGYWPVFSADGLRIPEGGTASFGVRLSAQPSADVTLGFTRSGDADITITGGSSLTFTPANWNTFQTVTVSAAEDSRRS